MLKQSSLERHLDEEVRGTVQSLALDLRKTIYWTTSKSNRHLTHSEGIWDVG